MAVSGDVYTAKAVIAARTPGAGGVGDGAGIMFAEGLYRNALRMIGTPRPPASTADDDDAAAGGAARADLRLAASVIHARYAAILKASGPQRKSKGCQLQDVDLPPGVVVPLGVFMRCVSISGWGLKTSLLVTTTR